MKYLATGLLTLTLIAVAGQGFAGFDWEVKAAEKIEKALAHQEDLTARAAVVEVTIDEAMMAEISSLIVAAQEAYTNGEWKAANSLAGQALDILDIIEGEVEAAEEAAEAEEELIVSVTGLETAGEKAAAGLQKAVNAAAENATDMIMVGPRSA